MDCYTITVIIIIMLTATENTPDVLSSSNMRTFWVSWSLGEIQVGIYFSKTTFF